MGKGRDERVFIESLCDEISQVHFSVVYGYGISNIQCKYIDDERNCKVIAQSLS